MSHNQFRAEKSEAQLRKPGRSGSSSRQQRSYFAPKGGGGTPPVASSSSVNRSYKKSSNGQGGQSRGVGFTVASSEPTAPVTAAHAVQNGPHARSQLSDAPVSGIPKPTDSSVPRSPQGLPRASSSQPTARATDSTVPTIPSEGDISRSFPLQFGSISPGFMNEMQIPARTSSAPPNLDEQKRDQASHNSFKTPPIAPVPSAPKQQPPQLQQQEQPQHQLRKHIGTLNQSSTAGSHLPEHVNREAHVQTPTALAAATTEMSSILPVAAMSMPMNFRPPHVPLQFGGPTSQIQSQGIATSSLRIPMPLPVGNASQVQQQVFIPGLPSYHLQPQGLVHQGQGLGFAPQMGHQLIPQLGNLGIGMPPQFPQQQAGNFGGVRKTIKITHPETHEELKLNTRTESYMDVGSSRPRSHPHVPAQCQPISSFPVNYYPHMQPSPHNPSSFFFPISTSLPPTSTQMNPVSSASGYNYTVGQGVQNISFMSPSALNPLPLNKVGHPMLGKSEPGKLEHIHDSHAVLSAPHTSSVQVTVKPSIGSFLEKLGSSTIMSTSPVSQIESPKFSKQPDEASFMHHGKDCEMGLENCVQLPKFSPQSSGSIPLPTTLKHSPSIAVSTPAVSPSASSVTFMPVDGSASVLTNAESRRSEPVKRSNSLKEQQKKHSKKEVCHFQRQQEDLINTAGSLKSPLLEMSIDSSFSDLNDDQGCTNPDENMLASSEAVGIPSTTSMEPSFSSSLEHNYCSVVGVSESEEAKTISFESGTSGVIFERARKISQGLTSNCTASKSTIDGIQVGQGGSYEQSCPSDFKADEAPSGNSDASGHVKQDGTAPLKVGLKQEITVTVEHRKTESSDCSPKDSGNVTGASAVSESYDSGKQSKEMSQIGKGTVNTQETDADESSCAKTEHFDMNVEAVGCTSEVNRTNDSLVQSASTPSGSMHAEIALSPLADFHEGKTSYADVSKILSEKSIACQEEIDLTDSAILRQGQAHVAPLVSTEATSKLEGRGTDSSSGGQVFTSSLASKDKISVEQNNAKGTARNKKKKREILKKADAAGRTSDLYVAYKGPEEKLEISVSSECKECSPAAGVKQAPTNNTEKVAVAIEDEGKSKGEADDWEDAAEISTPKLKASEYREQLRVAQKQNNDYESGITGKKYSRDFLLTFSEVCTYLPAGFEIRSDLVDALKSRQGAASHLIGRESYPNTGRIVDRPMGGSRPDRRRIGIMEDRWSRVPGPFSAGRDPRLDVGFADAGVSFCPPEGGNHGVPRNLRWQPGQYGGGILSGPMQSLASPGVMARSSPDSDRWQRATGSQRGLIPSPQTPLQVMHRADNRYKVRQVSDEEEAKQRQLKGILNKLTPQNFDKLFKQVKAVNIDNTTTLTGVISQIFDKAIMEPTFCEMYANFCFHLSTALPDFSADNEKITFRRLLLNKCQEEFERGEREEAEANRDDEEGEIKRSEEEKEQKKVQARRRMLGNIRLIGELYKKKMLTERIMHECIQKLLGQHQNPDEEDIEALCKLMSTIGEMIDHPRAKEHMDSYFNIMLNLSNSEVLLSRVRFMLKDTIDLRNNRWQQRRKIEGPKKIEEVHRDAAQERQTQVSRSSRGSAASSSARRGQPLNYGAQRSTTLSSLSSQQIGLLRGSPPQFRGYGTEDVQTGNRHPFENRTPSVPLSQRPVDDNPISLGPQGGLARDMSSRGQPLRSNAPLADTSSGHYDSRRMVSDRNGYSSVSDWTSYNNSHAELTPRYVPARFVAPPRGQSNSLETTAYSDSETGDSMDANHSFDRSGATTPSAGPVKGLSTGSQNALSESKVSTERLRDLSISAIREFYCARNEEEVRLCIKELNHPNFYPDMVMLWVTDSFDRKNDIDRDLLAKLLVNLCKSQESLLNQVQLIKGFESVLSSLEDVVIDSPKAAEYLGCILGMVIAENALSLKEIQRLINGDEEPGSLLESGLASDVQVSILRTLRREKGDSVLNEIRTSFDLRLEDF